MDGTVGTRQDERLQVLLALYGEHVEAARQHDRQRAQHVGFLVALSAGLFAVCGGLLLAARGEAGGAADVNAHIAMAFCGALVLMLAFVAQWFAYVLDIRSQDAAAAAAALRGQLGMPLRGAEGAWAARATRLVYLFLNMAIGIAGLVIFVYAAKQAGLNAGTPLALLVILVATVAIWNLATAEDEGAQGPKLLPVP